jgi:hypothetical protein
VRRADNLTTLACRLSRNLGALTSRTPQGHVGLFRGYFTFLPSYLADSWHSSSNQFVKFTINLHLMQGLRMLGTVPPFPPRMCFVKYTYSFISFWISNFRRVCFLMGFGTLCLFHLHRQVGVKNSQLPAYEDGTECSETSAYKIQTPGNYPEESTQLRLNL